MSLWPRRLVNQLLLVTIFALIAAQAINFALILQANRAERSAIIAATAAAALSDGADRVALGLPLPRRFGVMAMRDAAAREDRRGRNDDREGRRDRRGRQRPPPLRRMSLDLQPDFPANGRNHDRLAGRVQSMLADAGAPISAVRAVEAEIAPRVRGDGRRVSRIVAVSGQLADGRWLTVQAPVADASARPIWQLAGQTVILFVLLLLPVLWVARRASKPLAELTSAARAAQPGRMEVIAPSGPEDVQALSRALNDLNARIQAMLTDKDRMLGAVGHDLRTPLASLRVRVEQVPDEALRSAMSATIADMATMLDDIVALARAGHGQEQPELTDLAGLLAGLADDYRAMAKPVRLSADGAVIAASVRPAALRRALRNLIDNALTYGGDAELGLAAQNGQIALTVSDSGPGIDPANIAAMLEPFARAEQSRNRATGGAGLGLALAKAIAEGEGGKLTLANRPAGGLVATISLPHPA